MIASKWLKAASDCQLSSEVEKPATIKGSMIAHFNSSQLIVPPVDFQAAPLIGHFCILKP